jgi:mRNA interferase MazF
MRRGEIVFVNFATGLEGEVSRRRPAVIISRNEFNEATRERQRGGITVIPLTSNTDKIFPFQVFLPAAITGLPRDSKAQCEQVRTVAYARFESEPVGIVPDDYLQDIERALKLHLLLP